MNHFDITGSASKDLPKAIIIQQAKKVYIEESMKGIVRSMKPNRKFFERTWESFYKLYLHMKYGQDQRVDMNGFEKIMEHFAETKYKSRIEKREELVSEDDADKMYEYLLQHIHDHTIKLAKKRGKKITIPARPDPDMPEHMIPEHDDWKIPIVEVFNLLIILEVKFKTFLNSDAFKGMAIKAPAPCAPRPEDRDQAKEVKHMTDEEIQ